MSVCYVTYDVEDYMQQFESCESKTLPNTYWTVICSESTIATQSCMTLFKGINAKYGIRIQAFIFATSLKVKPDTNLNESDVYVPPIVGKLDYRTSTMLGY